MSEVDQASDPIRSAIDAEHLRLLSIGYVVSGVLSALFSLLGLVYLVIGIVMGAALSSEMAKAGKEAPPAFIGYVLGCFGLGIFLFMVLLAGLKFRAAWCLKHRRARTYCMVVAGISCLGIPYGTLLGVFSFVVLGRNSVRLLFEADTEDGPKAEIV